MSQASSHDPSEGPLFLVEDYFDRNYRQLRDSSGQRFTPIPGQSGSFNLLLEDYRPEQRFWEQASRGAPVRVEPFDDFALSLETVWDKRIPAGQWRSKAGALSVQLALLIFVLAQPRIEPRQLTDPESNREYTKISLRAPTPDEIAQLLQKPTPAKSPQRLTGQIDAPVRAVIPTPKPPIPTPVQPQPTPDQPVEPKLEVEPPPQLAAALEPIPAPAPVQRAAAQAPEPAPFRRGSRDPRRVQELPAPRSRPKPKPKLTLEDAHATQPGEKGPMQIGELGVNTRPDQVIEAAIQQMRTTGGGGSQSVGDGMASGGSRYLPPSPGNLGSGLELLSDPKGVDFRPYLLQVLNAVRRNWHAVLPESARLGMERGRTQIQFVVGKKGNVPKLVIASSSGSHPLDRAAVAGISASLPLPPLPAEYTGEEARLQFVFLYNMKR